MGRNCARVALTRDQLDRLAPGSRVVDADMDINTKREDGFWRGPTTVRSTVTLTKSHGPIKLWTGGPR